MREESTEFTVPVTASESSDYDDAASNTAPSCDALFAAIKQDQCDVVRSTRKTLEIHMDMGGKLKQIKDIVGDSRTFAKMADEKLHKSRAWCYRLMDIHARREAFYRALAWAEEQQVVVRFSVSAALNLIATHEEYCGTATRAKRKPRGKAPTLTENNAALKHENAKLQERLVLVEAKLSQKEAREADLEKDLEWERAKNSISAQR
jgi:hypothetical protein